VGRGKTRAYAYFTLPHYKTLTSNATKRLEVMGQLDSLGAGFTIASHDMDIRGFGNLVGEEQSGHIKEVGVELYQQMLEDAVRGMKEAGAGEALPDNDWSPQLNLGISTLIPETYVDDLSLRMGLYCRLGNLKTQEDIDQFAVELVDRFGKMPQEVEYLLQTVYIKQLCKQAGIDRADAGPKGLVISFRNDVFANPEALIGYVAQRPHETKIRGDQKLVLIRDWDTPEAKLKGVSQAISKIVGLIN
jgi:transcription-repair coupling factor (superfamily II helicase)